ncbi:hypothetical protein [Sphingomonas sp. TDK1]|uniref:hypothetical protein n=1 Tax=Sphingomonas sp. TDK1 TaxID=453247 RepID=UPI0007D99F41|nr:hypothetical protein [Sphingomonas sp. TDK1]OAN57243.1 hypothetical protein A7X12_08495 [Sphingomonas sp. TDK1]
MRLFGRGEIRRWRDLHVAMARAVLQQAAADLVESFDAELSEADWRDGLIEQTRFVAVRIAPVVRQVAEPLARRVVEEADRALQPIAYHHLQWQPLPVDANLMRDMMEELGDWAAAGGAALTGLVRGAATGLPIAGGLGRGLPRDWMRLRAEARLRAKVHGYVYATVVQGPKGRRSQLEHVIDLLQDAARHAQPL